MNAYRTRHAGRAVPVLVAIVLGFAAHGVPLAAADDAAAGPPAPADRSADVNLQEILVTATRRTEPLSKVPISVTAVSQDQMDALGVKDIQDLRHERHIHPRHLVLGRRRDDGHLPR